VDFFEASVVTLCICASYYYDCNVEGCAVEQVSNWGHLLLQSGLEFGKKAGCNRCGVVKNIFFFQPHVIDC